MTDAPPSHPGAANEPPSVSGLAITSFVSGLLGLCTAGLTGIISIPTGIMALVDISKRPLERKGQAFAIMGIVFPLLGCIVSLPMLLLPAIGKAKENAGLLKWQTQAMQVGQALLIQSNEAGGAIAGDGWQDMLLSQGYITADLLVPIGATRPALALNEAVAGTRIADIAEPAFTVLLFETAEGGPQVGNADDLAQPTNRFGIVIVFVDGHAEFMPPAEARALIWEPTPAGGSAEETP